MPLSRLLFCVLAVASTGAAAQTPLTWEPTALAYGTATDALAVTPAAVLGVVNGAVVRSTDDGRTWTPTTGASGVLRLAPHLNGEALATGPPGIFASDHNGGAWTQLRQALPTHWQCPYENWWTYAGATATGAVLAGGIADSGGAPFDSGCGQGPRMWRRPTDGAPWTSVLWAGPVVSLSRTSDGRLWAGTALPYMASQAAGLYVSADGGATWARVSGFGGYGAVAVAELADGPLLAANGLPPPPSGYYYPIGPTAGPPLLRSVDGGVTWAAFGDLPPGTMRALLAAPGGALYAASTTAVWRSTDGGQTWDDVSTGLPTFPVNSLTLTPGGHLLVGLAGGGYYRSADDVATPAEAPPAAPEPSLAVAPNPAAGALSVELTLGRAGEATLTLVDVLGRVVARVDPRALPAGMHRLVLDTTGLPAGTYVLRARLGTTAVTRPITITR